jgi:uncharacterized protein
MSLWGPLAARYETTRPRRMLALDGGGIRGVLTIEVLIEIEDQLREAVGGDATFRLCDFFDYIGGTSTGGIIAASLARGMSARDLLQFYLDIGPKMFEKPWLLRRIKNYYKSEPLAEQLKVVYQPEATLEAKYLRCLLLVVTRNRSTDSPWPISSNPLAKYNDPARPDCNLKIPLWQLVRASSAAPVYFPPEILQWDPTNPDKTWVFEDGGVTPYNNPAFLMYRMATLPEYRLKWATGEGNLMLVSVGTGAAPTVETTLGGAHSLLANASNLPGAFMYSASVDQDINCRTVGRCVQGAILDRELGDMIPRQNGAPIPLTTDLGKAFVYARYNADISEQGLAELSLTDVDPDAVAQLDSIKAIPDLRRIGQAVAAKVSMREFKPFLHL